MSEVPTPNTAHPVYANVAASIREGLRMGETFRVPEPTRPLETVFADESPVPTSDLSLVTHTLSVKKCAGPVPWVGDLRVWRAAYFWLVAVDELGRHVAGDTELVVDRRWH